MKRSLFLLIAAFCLLLALTAFAEGEVVYLDGTGVSEGAYTDFKTAVSALPNGGTVILTGDTTVGTASAGVTLNAVGGKVTVTSTNGARFIFARSLTLNSELEFDDINIHSTATASGNIICRGNKLTMGEGVTVTKASGAIDVCIIGGWDSGTRTLDSDIVLHGGTYRAVYAANYNGTFNGTSRVELSGVTVTGTLSYGNWQGTYNGTGTLILDLRGNKTVTAGTYKETPTILVDEGYEAVLSGGTYSQQPIGYTPEPDPTTVYVDGTGATEGAYTSFADAFTALSSEGGTVVVCGDTQLGTTSSGVILANYKSYSGKITITGQNGARLIFARSLRVNTELEFENIHIHSIIPSNLSSVNNIIASGNTITVGEGVTVTRDDGTLYPCIIGGQDANTSYNTSITVRGGTWQNIWGGGYNNTFAGNSTVLVSGATVIGRLTASSREGSFTGTPSLTLDLRGGKTVSAASFDASPTLLVDEGYEGVLVGGTYMQRLPVSAEPKTVYLDGTGRAPGAFTTFAAALANMPGGGTIVVCGDTDIGSTLALSTGGELLITSVYADEDYTDTAVIRLGADLSLGCPVTFADVVLDKAISDNVYIVANGNRLVMDEGVFCRNNLASNFPVLVGGAKSGTFVGDSEITVKSGFFRNIHGGNLNGTFKGNAVVNFLGGYVDNMVTGGTFMGNFEGGATVNIGGDAVLPYSASGSGVCGGSCGSGSASYTFTGDIHLNLYGKARVNQSVYGTTRWPNVTTTGDVYITIRDDAFVYQNLYAGGHSCTLSGNTSVIMDGGWVGVNLAAGSRGGTVNGNTYLEINGGKVNYYATNIHSSVSDPAGTYNTAGGGLTGSVTGNTVVRITGGDIYGNVYGGAIDTGTVGGSSTVTVTGGSVMCGIYAGGSTSTGISSTKTLHVDLSGGKTLAVGLPMAATTITGGGKLIVFPEAVVTANTLTGNLAFEINGKPQARNYITASSYAGASVSYTPQNGEPYAFDGGVFSISPTGYYASTRVTFLHRAGVTVDPRKGITAEGDKVLPVDSTDTSTSFDFAPGLYNCYIRHSASDFKRVFVYITGEKAEIELDYTVYAPKTNSGFEAGAFYENTKDIYDTYYNNGDLIGYKTPDSPYFNNDRYGTRRFTSNAEMLAFVNEKVAACDYAYAFKLFTSFDGDAVPAVLFTKDEIPARATLADAAKIVTSQKGRDVILVTAQTHGNEPSGGEGALAMISEMCGEYGDSFLTGNIGAVIIIPRVNPDGSRVFTRGTPNGFTVDSGKKIENLNRDYSMLTSSEVSGVVKAFSLFAPTVFIDCHEAGLTPNWGQSQTLTDIYDVGLMSAGILNSPFVDTEAIIKGNYKSRDMRTIDAITDVMESIEDIGLRTYYYQMPMTFAANHTAYGLTLGAYSFLIEVPGLAGGDSIFARRVFTHVSTLKSIFNYTKATDGEMAREVEAAREELSRAAQKFDLNSPIILYHQYSRHDETTFLWNNPLIGSDGTVRRAENITKYYIHDIAVKYRARPTAYVVAKGTAGLDKVLATLDRQGIAYFELDAGTTLNLKRYSGNATTATLGSAGNVLFANGAYIVPVDGYKAYLISSLFEPECQDSGEEINTFVQAGYIAASDIYRSEENYIAAKLGLDGTYKALSTGGKTLESVTVDGAVRDDVDIDGGNAYVLSSAGIVTLRFTDGTRLTFSNMAGDADGDGVITLADVLRLLRGLLDRESVSNFDANGDGRFSLADVLRTMRILAQ